MIPLVGVVVELSYDSFDEGRLGLEVDFVLKINEARMNVPWSYSFILSYFFL